MEDRAGNLCTWYTSAINIGKQGHRELGAMKLTSIQVTDKVEWMEVEGPQL